MNIDLLDKIKEVEPSPFIFNKIEIKLRQQTQAVPKELTWVLGSAFVIVICLNVYLIRNQFTKTPQIESFAQSMNLISNNNIYQ